MRARQNARGGQQSCGRNDIGMRADIAGNGDGEFGAARRRRPRRLSQVFSELSMEARGPVSIATIRDALGDRSFAALLFFFAVINLIPLPPGTSALLGLPLLIVSAQMVYGSKRARLPRILSIARSRPTFAR